MAGEYSQAQAQSVITPEEAKRAELARQLIERYGSDALQHLAPEVLLNPGMLGAWKRMQTATLPQLNAIQPMSAKDHIESMIQAHKSAIEALETALTVANMASALNDQGAKNLLEQIIIHSLRAVGTVAPGYYR